MAAAAVNLRRRSTRGIITQIWSAATANPLISSNSASSPANFRRGANYSSGAYEKNVDEQVRATVVPDYEVIDEADDKYWAPHPHTGVFGPVSAASRGRVIPNSNNDHQMNAADQSVLEEQAWFRPTSLEDLEKPATHH